MNEVHVVVPDRIDDPTRPSGGNTYDRRVCDGLVATGWSVHEHSVPGDWPCPEPAAELALMRTLTGFPDGSLVLIDGLVASSAPAAAVPEIARLRSIILVHMPLESPREASVLTAARAVVATSSWTRDRLRHRYALPARSVHVAAPGTEPAELAAGTPGGGELLCVGTVAPHKGHDVLLAALTDLRDLPWRCMCVGPLDRDPGFVDDLRRRARSGGLDDRLCFTGARTGEELDRAYAGADVLVLASHAETYGMVVTEALARGLPVVATAVGGVPEALGCADDGRRPGLLVPAGDRRALTHALGQWLRDGELRQRLRDTARNRRTKLTGWPTTSDQIAHVLGEVAA